MGVVLLLATCVVAAFGLAGCTLPGMSPGSTEPNLAAATERAISQLQAILGLPLGTITRSSDQPILPDSEVALKWSGGRADVDADTGLISCVLMEPSETASGPPLNNTVLDQEADRISGLLGWNKATLTAQGFTRGTSRTVDRGSAGAVYQKTWVGHDEEGIPNQGIIEVGLDKATGELRSFLYSPGPWAAAALVQEVTKNEAVEIAIEAAGRDPLGPVTTTSTATGRTTASTTTSRTTTTNRTTTTARPLSLRLESATLVHTDARGITGGGDALVWIVKLAGTASGVAGVTVYVDAVTGEVLSVITAG